MTEEDRAPIRAAFFVRIFEVCCRRGLPDIFRTAEFDGEDASCLADLYFGMSDSYKGWRLRKTQHRTNDYKKAGVTTAAIMAMRPIRFAVVREDLKSIYANQIFALACATGILNQPLYRMPDEDRTQFYLWLDTLRFPSTDPYLRQVLSRQTQAPQQPIHLSHIEVSHIDMIVQKITDQCRLYDLELRLHDQGTEP